jgi:hypothetical protein
MGAWDAWILLKIGRAVAEWARKPLKLMMVGRGDAIFAGILL